MRVHNTRKAPISLPGTAPSTSTANAKIARTLAPGMHEIPGDEWAALKAKPVVRKFVEAGWLKEIVEEPIVLPAPVLPPMPVVLTEGDDTEESKGKSRRKGK